MQFLGAQSRGAIWVIAIVATVIVGTADLLIGYEYSTTLFYVIPVAIASWYGSRNAGVVLSFIASLTWLLTDVGAGREYSHSGIVIWNTWIRLGVFVVIAVTLAAFRKAVKQVEQAADTDYLTGLLNRRGFHQKLSEEHARCVRYNRPFTLAYIDLDNFKAVNDRCGHDSGDQLLVGVAETLEKMLRATDKVARLGGDEFAVLFPETNNDAASAAFLHAHTRLMEYMAAQDWPVTFSVGVVTFETAPATIEQTLKVADELMYSVKHGGKNNIVCQVWSNNA